MKISALKRTNNGYIQFRGHDRSAYLYKGEDAKILDLVFKYWRK